MRLSWSAEDEAFRTELGEFLEEHAPPEATKGRHAEGDGSTGDALIPDWARQWQATLFDHGWMVPGYPPELGGRNATPVQTLVYFEELARRSIPRSLHFPGYAIVAPSLLEFGDERQRALAPAAIRGDTVWCIGMSEPGAGSDLASLSTRAVRDGERFIVNGQKVWTSYAMLAERCFCYVRTDPEAPKHKGISVLVVDMDSPGIEVRPLRHLTGAAEFAEVFFTDVEVPVENVVGAVSDGWRITMGSLAHERGGLWLQNVAGLQHALDDLVNLVRERGLTRDGSVRRSVAIAYEQVASLRALGYKGFAAYAGGSSAPEHSYLKLATSELGKTLHELGMQLQGPFGSSWNRWSQSFFVSFASTIAGGTSEVQRNIIATRILGLPLMDFTLTDEQELLRSTARTLFTKHCPPSLVRASIDDPEVAAPLWARLREWVVLGDGALVDHCLFLEEAGAVCAPGPYFVTSAVAVPLLRAAGMEWDGHSALSVAWAGADGVWSLRPAGLVRTFVLDADRVDRIVVVAPGPVVEVVDPLPCRLLEGLDLTRRPFDCELPAARSVEPVDLEPVLARATVALAAEMMGTARWLLDTSIQYARGREQFGRPIGSFQAIQHKLADMALEVERAWAAVFYAAMAIDAGDPDRHRAVHVAKAAAGAAATWAAKDGIQVHGGIGYTWEHDLHLYIRRAYGSEHLLGTSGWHHDRLADLLLTERM